MADTSRTKEQLISELEELRRRFAELEASESKRQQVEDATKEKQKELESLLDSLRDFMFVINSHGQVVHTNKAVRRRLGYTRKEISKMSVPEFHPPDRREEAASIIADMLAGKREICPIPLLTKDGSYIPVETKVAYGVWKGEKALFGISRDVTDRLRAEQALRESEETFRSLFETMAEGVILIAPDGRIIRANAMAEKILGLELSEIENRNYVDPEWDIIRADGTVMPHEEMAGPVAIRERKVVQDMVMGIRHHDSSISWINVSAAPIIKNGGELVGAVLTFADITPLKQAEEALQKERDILESRIQERTKKLRNEIAGRKRTEEALRESEEKYRSLVNDVLESSAVGIFILDRNFKVLWVNHALERYFGVRREDIIGSDKRQLIHERVKYIFEDPEGFARTVLATYDDNTYVENFECHVLPDGKREERWLEHWSQPIKTGLYAGGRIEHYTDITKRKHTDEALRESEARFRRFFEDSPIGIAISGCDRRFINANSRFCEMLGYAPEEIIGSTFAKITHPDHVEKDRKNIDKLSRREITVYRTEKRYIKKSKEILWALTTVSGLYDNEGKLLYYLAMVDDITERKRTEDTLKHRLKLERTVAIISSWFVGTADIDAAINTSLADIGRLSHASRAYLFLFNHEKATMDNTHEWCNDGVSPQIDNLKNLPLAMFPWWIARLRKGETIHIREVSKMPAAARAEREILESQDIKSLLVLPVLIGRKLSGFMGFDNVVDTGTWSDDDLSILRICSEIIGNTLERKETEEALRQSEERFRLMAETSPDYMVQVDKQGKVLYASPAVKRILGFDPTEVEGKDYASFISEAKSLEAQFLLERAYKGEVIQNVEVDLIHKNGSTGPIEVSGAPIIINDEVVSLFGVARDITERRQMEEEIKWLSSAVEQSIEPITITDSEGNITYVNQAMLQLYGYSRDELIGKAAFMLNANPNEAESVRVGIESEGKWAGEIIQRRKDQTQFPAWLSMFAIKGSNGNGQIVVAFISDITERKQAEESLKESEARYRTVVDTALEGICITNEEETITFANPAFAKMLGYTAQELVGQNLQKLVSREDWRIISAETEKRRRGTASRYEVSLLSKKGVVRSVIVSAAPFLNADDRFLGSLGVIMDITESKQAEELLRTSAINSPVGVYIVQGGKFIYANPQFEKDTGYDEEELLGMNSLDLVVPEDREMVRKNAINMLKGERSTPYEFRIINKNGDMRWALETVAPIQYHGAPVAIGSFQDITERRQVQEDRQRIARLESVGTLAGGIAHDFNNLLTGIMGNISLAKRYIDPQGKAFGRLEEAENASERARDLTQQLLTFSRGGKPVKKLVSIQKLIRDSAGFVLKGSNVRCDFSLPDDLWPVEVDEGQMNQVINNLVINANEAMPTGGIINIKAKNITIKKRGRLPLSRGNYIKIFVEDHGIGIPEGLLTRIFEPYFTTKQKGSGLGLATTYSVIKNHDGHITVTSKRDIGTTFCIYLPASKRLPPKAKETVEEKALTGGGRILVMDDEESIREMLSSMLGLAGYEVEVTSGGAEAIEQYSKFREAKKPFDAVILDLTVPGGMGGKDTIKKLLEIDPGAKVIVSSGYSTDPIMSDFKKYGFSAVVTKPYNVSEIEKILLELTEQRGGK